MNLEIVEAKDFMENRSEIEILKEDLYEYIDRLNGEVCKAEIMYETLLALSKRKEIQSEIDILKARYKAVVDP